MADARQQQQELAYGRSQDSLWGRKSHWDLQHPRPGQWWSDDLGLINEEPCGPRRRHLWLGARDSWRSKRSRKGGPLKLLVRAGEGEGEGLARGAHAEVLPGWGGRRLLPGFETGQHA